MRKGSIELSLDIFMGEMNSYIEILLNVISDDSSFEKYEQAEIFEAFVLKICACWEFLVENLLVDCLNRDVSQYASYMDLKLPKHMSHNQCRAMLIGIGYIGFKGVSDVKKKAKDILVDEFNPFAEIPNSVGKKIDEFYKFRNFIAHRSIRANQALNKVYKNTYRLKNMPEPGNFLVAIDKKTKRPRMGAYTGAFQDAAVKVGEYFELEYIIE